MEEKDIFRTAVFGGYQKDDVTDYIRSLENENETIRILANKEKNDLKTQLEKEKAVSEELKTSLAALHDKLSDLEKSRKEEAPSSPAPSGAEQDLRQDVLKFSLEEERKAIQEDRQQWADNLAKMQQDMQSLWQNELQQLRSTLETIQSNLKQPACESQDTDRSQDTFSKYDTSEQQDTTQEPHSSARTQDVTQEPLSPARTQDMAQEPLSPARTQDMAQEPLSPVSETSFSEKETGPEEDAAPAHEEPQKAEYIQKADTSISHTQKRVSDLLLKLDDF